MRASAEEIRKAGLVDRKLIPEKYREKLDIEHPLGGGRTNPWTYTVSTEYYISNYSVRSPQYVDLRQLPHIGD